MTIHREARSPTALGTVDAPRETPAATLTPAEKAAVIIGVLGSDAAGTILERLDESALRAFTGAMSRLRRVSANDVRATITEFITCMKDCDETVRGGPGRVREVLQPHVTESVLDRLLDDMDAPSIHNVWKKLAKVNDEALAGFLAREHPQTAAVVLSKLSAEHAARILNRLDPDRARDVVIGITRTSSLDPKVVEAIGAAVSRDFLTAHQNGTPRRDPAERIGSILNHATSDLRDHVLEQIGRGQPDFAEEIRRRMFTFEDIPRRIEPRDAGQIIRQVEQDTLLKALRFAQDQRSDVPEFLLGSISVRVAEQLRQDLGEMERVRRKDGETAQSDIVATIRRLAADNRIRLLSPDEET